MVIYILIFLRSSQKDSQMGRSSQILRSQLDRVINVEKTISITELERRTGIKRKSIYGYLAGAVPDLDSLDKLADALDMKSWDAIKLVEGQRPPTPQEIDDEKALERMRKGLQCLRREESEFQVENESKVKKGG